MADAAEKIVTITDASKSSKTVDNSQTAIRNRRSQELIIGLCGAVGSGVKSLKGTLTDQLNQHGYHVEHIRLSDLIAETQTDAVEIKKLTGFDRYKRLQDLGDALREEHQSNIVAELGIRKISILRDARFGGGEPSAGALKITKKVAYIVDQLKHPSEIELFQEVYRNNFYLIGLLRTEDERRANLKDEPMDDSDIAVLIERDRKSTDDNGQQVEKSLHKSDYFIRNIDVAEEIVKSVTRFIKLVHGTNHVTPTKDETGIYTAYSASLRSACLSRQVGAAITDDEGVVLSMGCNDVPKFGGGLYNAESAMDKRCFNHSGGTCHNDKHKNLLKLEIENILKGSNVTEAEEIAEKIVKNSKAKSLIEYSRAIHAEMDAITALARSTNNSTLNKTLYCTTYPCHNCARHIVAAGVKRVVYIEPYEKSLAMQLHSDTICHPENRTQDDKVLFENFEGVAPKRYAKFFGYNQKRKGPDGKAIPYTVVDSGHVDPQQLDSYAEYELKVVQLVNEKMSETEGL